MTRAGPTPEALARALQAARRELVAALAGLTERDFAAELTEGTTVVSALAELVRGELSAIAQARDAAGLPPRVAGTGGSPSTRPLPPQVTHALAGARYEVRLLLAALPPDEAVGEPIARALLEGIAGAEHDAATRIAALPPAAGAAPPTLEVL